MGSLSRLSGFCEWVSVIYDQLRPLLLHHRHIELFRRRIYAQLWDMLMSLDKIQRKCGLKSVNGSAKAACTRNIELRRSQKTPKPPRLRN